MCQEHSQPRSHPLIPHVLKLLLSSFLTKAHECYIYLVNLPEAQDQNLVLEKGNHQKQGLLQYLMLLQLGCFVIRLVLQLQPLGIRLFSSVVREELPPNARGE
jgi:hypothetical protein